MTSRSIFDPIKIGDLEIKNRVVMAPMATNFANPDGSVSANLIGYLKKRASGGVGAIITGYAHVDKLASKSLACQLGIYCDSLVPGLNRLVEEAHSFGTKCILQIAHGGAKARPKFTEGKPRSPSGKPFSSSDKTWETKKLTEKKIEEIIDSFIEAACRAERADFDGVEIHGAHNYLISEFLSPKFNNRDDQFGGSLEERAKILLEIIEGVKEEADEDFVVGVRFNGKEFMEDGLELKKGVEIGKILEEAGVDYLNVSVTGEPGTSRGKIGEDEEPGAFVEVASEIKNAVSIPIATVGGLHDPELIKDVVGSGKADLVAVGRGLLSEPNLVRKIKKKRENEIVTCIRCNHCSERIFSDKEIRCPINHALGREIIG